jgi:hypothetical protein
MIFGILSFIVCVFFLIMFLAPIIFIIWLVRYLVKRDKRNAQREDALVQAQIEYYKAHMEKDT